LNLNFYLKKSITFLSSSLIRETAIYTFATILNSAIPFFLIPILTRFLTPEDYGLISIYGVLVAFVTPFIGYSIHSSITRMYFSSSPEELAEYIGNCFFILGASTLLTCLIFFLIEKKIEEITQIPMVWIWSTIILAITQFITLIPLTLWQVRKKAFFFGVFQIFSTLINFGITLFLVIILKRNWVGRIEAQIITGIIFSVITLFFLFKNGNVKFIFRKTFFVDGLKFGVPLIPHVIGGIFLTIVNRFFLAKYVGLKETGLFFLAFQLTSIINIFTNALNTAYVPWLFEKLEKNNELEKQKIVILTYKYFLLLIVASIIFSLFLPLVLHSFVGKRFYGSEKYFYWLILSCVFNGMYLMVTNYIVFVKKTYILAWITFFSSLITITLNYFLILSIGALGCAIASAIGFGLLFLLTWVLSANVYEMPWFNLTKNRLLC